MPSNNTVVNAEWAMNEKDKKILAAIDYHNRTTTAQLTNFFDMSPKKLVPRMKPMAEKFKKATKVADHYDDEDYSELEGELRETVLHANSYRLIWQEMVKPVYTDVVTDYNDAYGDT